MTADEIVSHVPTITLAAGDEVASRTDRRSILIGDAGLIGADDMAHLMFAARSERVLVTTKK